MINRIEAVKETSSVTAPVDHARNALIRRVTQEPLRKLAEATHERFPRLSPNHITVGAALVEMAGTKIATKEQKKQNPRKGVLFLAAGLKAVGYGGDGLDGALARAIPGRNTNFGQILDYFIDRLEEMHSAYSRAESATTRLGRWAAWSEAVSCIAPGLARANTEAKGNVVPEHGRTLFEALGTRLGRIGLDLAATVSPQSVRTGLNVVGTIANVNSTIKRVRDGSNADEEKVLDESKIKQAKVRRLVLGGLLAADIAVVIAKSRRKH